MSIISSADGSTTGAPVPHSLFPDDAWLYVKVPARNSGIQPTFQAVPKGPEVTNLQAFNSGVFGNPTNEDIWAFKANRLAQMAVAMAAITESLSDTVNGLSRPDWEKRIPKLNKMMQEVYTESKALCDAVSAARSK